ncbi:16S rRNA (cytidine(1402)-2'-O)-methyltransferase [soil metagenome]
MIGTLNIITTPIGCYVDITIRAIETLKSVDYIICEEFKEAKKLLKAFQIEKDLRRINEHTESSQNSEEIDEIFHDILTGKNVGLISDAGTPLFADPGKDLVKKCIEFNVKIEFFHGANSLLAALVCSGFDISRFYYIGFISPKTEHRIRELKELAGISKVMALLEAPYRLKQILTDISKVMPVRKIYIGFDLTMPGEKHFRGKAMDILEELGTENIKGEFVIIIDKPEKIVRESAGNKYLDIDENEESAEENSGVGAIHAVPSWSSPAGKIE